MSTPPRRRRPESRRSQSRGGGASGWLPTVAMGLGVIIAGLGIGALVAILMQRNAPKDAAVAVVTSTPSVEPSRGRAPIVIATFAPPRTPRPSPASPPSPSPTPSSEATEAPSPSPRATSMPTTQPTKAAVADAPSAAPTADPSVPLAVAQTSTPIPTQTVGPSAAPSVPSSAASSAAPSSVAAAAPPTTYEQHASGVVRTYLDALIRGDQKTAYRALGESAGAASLTEQSFLDPSARIVSLKVTRIDASNASVGCEITAAKGHYYATYHVTAGSSGPYIIEHDYIKV